MKTRRLAVLDRDLNEVGRAEIIRFTEEQMEFARKKVGDFPKEGNEAVWLAELVDALEESGAEILDIPTMFFHAV